MELIANNRRLTLLVVDPARAEQAAKDILTAAAEPNNAEDIERRGIAVPVSDVVANLVDENLYRTESSPAVSIRSSRRSTGRPGAFQDREVFGVVTLVAISGDLRRVAG